MSLDRQLIDTFEGSQCSEAFERARGEPPPVLQHAWADAAVLFWGAMWAQGAIDASQPLIILDLGAPSGLIAWALPRLLAERLERSSCAGMAVSYKHCPADGVKGLDVGGNPLVCVGWKCMGSLASAHYALDRGNVYIAEMQEPPSSGHADALLAYYAICCGRSPVVLPLAAIECVSALASQSRERYLFLGADLGIVNEPALREQVIGKEYLNLHALLLDRTWHGARTWYCQPGDAELATYLVAGSVVPLAAIEVIGKILEQGQAYRSLAIMEAASYLTAPAAAKLIPAMLASTSYFPALLQVCPRHIDFSALHSGVAQQWRAVLEQTWNNYRTQSVFDCFYRCVAEYSASVGDWGLAKQCIESGLQLHGDNPVDLVFLARCESASGDLNRAHDLLLQAVALAPCDTNALSELEAIKRRLADVGRLPVDPGRRDPSGVLVLEALHMDHAPALLRQYRDRGIAAMAGLPELQTLAQVRQWIRSQRLTGGLAAQAIIHRRWGLVGMVFLRRSGRNAYFYFWAGCDFQGCGYASNAARLLFEMAKEAGVHSVYTSVREGNYRSRRALDSLGFTAMEVCIEEDQRLLFMHKSLVPGVTREEVAEWQLQTLCREIAAPFRFASAPAVLQSSCALERFESARKEEDMSV